MLAKVTSKNQLTLPKSVTNAIGPVEYFDYVEMPAAHGPAAIPVRFTPGERQLVGQ